MLEPSWPVHGRQATRNRLRRHAQARFVEPLERPHSHDRVVDLMAALQTKFDRSIISSRGAKPDRLAASPGVRCVDDDAFMSLNERSLPIVRDLPNHTGRV